MDFSVLLLLMIAKEEELFFGAKQNHHHSWWICYTSIHQQKHSKVLGDKKILGQTEAKTDAIFN